MLITSAQWIVIYFIIIEFSLVVFLVILVYIVKIRSYFRGKVIRRLQQKFTEMLQTYAADGNLEPFRQVRQRGLLLFTARQKVSLSEDKLSRLVEEIILPVQVNNVYSLDWKKRYRLMICFEHYIDSNYFYALIHLIEDPIPIIRINACIIGSSLGNDDVFQAILDQLLKEDRAARTLYVNHFKINEAFRTFLFNHLKQTDDSTLKRVIYEILDIIGCNDEFFDVVYHDSFYGELDKRLGAIRCLPKINNPETFTTLKRLLEDDNWLVRNVAVRALGELENSEVVELLGTMLTDPSWWVKITSAKMLASAGNAGIAMLKKIKGNEAQESAEFAKYFLHIAETKRG